MPKSPTRARRSGTVPGDAYTEQTPFRWIHPAPYSLNTPRPTTSHPQSRPTLPSAQAQGSASLEVSAVTPSSPCALTDGLAPLMLDPFHVAPYDLDVSVTTTPHSRLGSTPSSLQALAQAPVATACSRTQGPSRLITHSSLPSTPVNPPFHLLQQSIIPNATSLSALRPDPIQTPFSQFRGVEPLTIAMARQFQAAGISEAEVKAWFMSQIETYYRTQEQYEPAQQQQKQEWQVSSSGETLGAAPMLSFPLRLFPLPDVLPCIPREYPFVWTGMIKVSARSAGSFEAWGIAMQILERKQ